MIIPNGHIEIREVVGGNTNPQDGFLTPAQGVWSERIACQYTPKSYRHASVVGGEHYTQASYDILVDALEIECIKPTTIRLTDEKGNAIGEFPIISIRHLKGVRVCKITV